MIHNLLLMMHLLLHNHLQPMEVLQLALLQGQPTTQLPRPMRPLPTIFLLAMVFDLPHTSLSLPHTSLSLPHTSLSLPHTRLSLPHPRLSLPHTRLSLPHT